MFMSSFTENKRKTVVQELFPASVGDDDSVHFSEPDGIATQGSEHVWTMIISHLPNCLVASESHYTAYHVAPRTRRLPTDDLCSWETYLPRRLVYEINLRSKALARMSTISSTEDRFQNQEQLHPQHCEQLGNQTIPNINLYQWNDYSGFWDGHTYPFELYPWHSFTTSIGNLFKIKRLPTTGLQSI